jgi:AraC-like DNA-binding protein
MTSRKHSSTRNGGGEFEHDLEQAQLDAQAARLRSNRLTYPQIAEQMGCSVSTAYTRVKRALAAVPVEAVQELRRIDLADLDWQAQRLRLIVLEDHYTRAAGGKEYLDRRVNIAALRELRLVNESRRKLLGTDAPAEVRLTVRDEIASEIERLSAELGLSDEELQEVLRS